MLSKRIIVLANSVKKNARCVAGVDVGTGKSLAPAGWIRPVSGASEGELEPRHMRMSDNAPLVPLDIVDIPLIQYAKDTIHPEDWIVDAATKWTRVGRLDPKTLDSLEEQPKDLWLESTSHSDRVTGGFLSSRSKHQSIYLIRPSDFRVELSYEHNSFKNKNQKKSRAKFTYHGHAYQMSLTDPAFTNKYCTAYPALGAQQGQVPRVREPHSRLQRLPLQGRGNRVGVAMIENGDPRPHLFTIGHSDHEMPEFISLLTRHGVDVIADVRSQPYSRFHDQFNRETLSKSLRAAAIQYVFLGRELGARRSERESYQDGQARYALISRLPSFRDGLDRIRRGLAAHRIALLCAEKDPITCHRTVLVCRHLRRDPIVIRHIMEDGSIETTEEAETRLLEAVGLPQTHLFHDRSELIEQAYDLQAERIAYTESEVPHAASGGTA